MYKGKIIVLILTFIWGLGACTNEHLIPTNSEGVEVTFNTALNVNELTTKAAPTTDESKIANCIVAVFEKKSDGGVGKCYDIYAGDYPDAGISLRAKSGTVRVVAIANYKGNVTIPADLSLDNPATITYSKLKILTSTLTTFISNNLVKTVDTDILLAVGKVVNGEYQPEQKAIALNQLPARMDVSIGVDEQDASFETTGYSVDGLNLSSNLFLTTTTTAENLFKTGSLTNITSGITNNTFSFYSYEKKTFGAPVIITVSGKLTKKDKPTTDKTYRLTVDPKIDLPSSPTNGIVHNYVYTVTGKINTKDGVTVTLKVAPWVKQPVNVEYGGDNSNGSNRPKS